MMRHAYLPLFVISCAATVEPERDDPDRVAAISSASSTGAVTAERRVSFDGAWASQTVALAIASGAVEWRLDENEATLVALALKLGPIEIPSDLLGYPVQLTEIELALSSPVHIAQGGAELPLTLTWSLTNHNVTSPLGSPDLPPLPATVEVDVDSINIHVAADGLIWEWASLLRLRDLSLTLASSR